MKLYYVLKNGKPDFHGKEITLFKSVKYLGSFYGILIPHKGVEKIIADNYCWELDEDIITIKMVKVNF